MRCSQLGYSLEPIGYLFRRVVPFHPLNRAQGLQTKYLCRRVIPQLIPKAPDRLGLPGSSFDGALSQAIKIGKADATKACHDMPWGGYPSCRLLGLLNTNRVTGFNHLA